MHKFSTVEKYIAAQPAQVRPSLKQLRKIIRKNAPGAEEKISYGMPGYKFHGMLVYFAAFKEHYTFFGRPRIMQQFKEELKKYSTSKSGLRIPHGKAVPAQLIARIVRASVKSNLHDAILKEMKRSSKAKK